MLVEIPLLKKLKFFNTSCQQELVKRVVALEEVNMELTIERETSGQRGPSQPVTTVFMGRRFPILNIQDLFSFNSDLTSDETLNAVVSSSSSLTQKWNPRVLKILLILCQFSSQQAKHLKAQVPHKVKQFTNILHIMFGPFLARHVSYHHASVSLHFFGPCSSFLLFGF